MVDHIQKQFKKDHTQFPVGISIDGNQFRNTVINSITNITEQETLECYHLPWIQIWNPIKQLKVSLTCNDCGQVDDFFYCLSV